MTTTAVNPSITTRSAEPAERRLGKGLLTLMSVATGLSVAGNYYAHPLLDVIGRDLHLGTTTSALIVTAAQVGYGLGLFLLVPLGDRMERRRLAMMLYGATALFVLVMATAVNGAMLLAGAVLAAAASVGAQVVVPIAVSLAAPAERGKVVGTVMTGLLMGMLLARTFSGVLSELGGWRTVYWFHAAAMITMAGLLRRFLPRLDGEGGGMSYGSLLRSTLTLLRSEPVLRWRSAIAALSLGAFTVMWTSLTFLLAEPPYGWSEASIGLFGLLGAAGAMAANVAGRLADRGRVQLVTGGATVLLLASWLALGLGGRSIVLLVIGVLVLDMAQQALLNSNQNVVYALRPEARNRINAAFMTTFFIGGAVGSALTSVIWVHGGWTAVSILGATLAAGTVVLFGLERLATARAARVARAASA